MTDNNKHIKHNSIVIEHHKTHGKHNSKHIKYNKTHIQHHELLLNTMKYIEHNKNL